MLFGKKKQEIRLPDNARCSKCRRKLKKGMEFAYIDGKLYCQKCARAKRDWDLLEMMMILDDD